MKDTFRFDSIRLDSHRQTRSLTFFYIQRYGATERLYGYQSQRKRNEKESNGHLESALTNSVDDLFTANACVNLFFL